MTTTPAKKTSAIGCLLGCCAVTALFGIAVCGLVYYLFRFGPFASAPPVDTTARLGGGPALVLRVDAEAPGAFSLAQLNDPGLNAYNGALLRMFRPYEVTVQLDAAADGSVVGLSGAMSMPRGSDVVLGMLENVKRDFEKHGREISALTTDPENKGVVIGHGLLPLPAEAAALRGEAWPETLPGNPPTVEHGHFVEFALDNRAGGGALAMAALAQAFSDESGDGKGAPLSLLSQVRLIKGSRMVRTAWGALDISSAGDVTLKYRISATNEVCAILLAGTLAQVPYELMDQLKELGEDVPLQVSPSQTREGTEISGEITIIGVMPAARAALLEFNANRGDDPFGFMPLPDELPAQGFPPMPDNQPSGNTAHGS